MSSQDRRAAPRHLPACDRVRIAWMEGKDLRRAEAHLTDLSSGGAAIAFEGPAPSGGPVWLGLEGTPHSDWVIAEIVRVTPLEGTQCRAGLRFVRPCALKFFRKALWRHAGDGEAAPAIAAHGGGPTPHSCWSARSSRSQGLIRGAELGARSLPGTPA